MSVILKNEPSSHSTSSLVQWLTSQIINNSQGLAESGAGVFGLSEKISEALRKNPIQEWEADRWLRGIKLRMIKMEQYFIRVGEGRAAPLSLFVRNEKGLNVGLRRESITQLASYVTLVTDLGYSRRQTRFESRWMDVVVYDRLGEAFIYAETKAALKTLNKLCDRLKNEFREEIPPLPETESGRVVDDPLMKAHHIWRNKPVYFWAIAPERRMAFEVQYNQFGFCLNEIDQIPHAQQEAPKRGSYGYQAPF